MATTPGAVNMQNISITPPLGGVAVATSAASGIAVHSNDHHPAPALSIGNRNERSLPVIVLNELGGTAKEWTLTVHPEHLTLAESPGAVPYVLLRDQAMKSFALIEGIPAFGLTKPIKRTFKMTRDAAATLAEWIGKPVLAAAYLKRRYAWVLPLAILWILGSLPLAGDPSVGIDAVPFDPIGLGLGLTLVISWAFAKWRPHPTLFLVDSIWFLVMGGQLIMSVFEGRSKGWLVLVPFLLWMIVTGLKHFFRFRGTRMTSG